jgi:peptide methionine sulfoxide reductase MsrA
MAVPACVAFNYPTSSSRIGSKSTALFAEESESGLVSGRDEVMRNQRRSFIRNLGLVSTAAVLGLEAQNPQAAVAADDTLTPVYFGVGCFWHIQHEFVEAERRLLGRGDNQLTSLTGYAGGKKIDKEGLVCYHNLQGVADYGKLGHGEAVGMTIPQSKIGNFAQEYFSLFAKNGNRVDPLDKGPEYRSLLGLPGGTSHPSYVEVEAAATNAGFMLMEGKGNDPDTLGKKLVWIMDSDKFPFYQAEVYHQFHNDFQSPA